MPSQGWGANLKTCCKVLPPAAALGAKRRSLQGLLGRREITTRSFSKLWGCEGKGRSERRTAESYIRRAHVKCLSADAAQVLDSSSDYYQVLKIERNADKASIKRAYRQLAKEYHPDVNPSAQAHNMFVILSTAYEVLIDDEQRSLYDKYGADGVKGLPNKSQGSAWSVWEDTWDEFKRTKRKTRRGDAREAASSASQAEDGPPSSDVAVRGDVVEYPLSEAAKARYGDGRTHGVGFIVSRNLDRGDRDKLPAEALDLVELEPLYREPGEEQWVADPLESAHFSSLRFVRRLNSEYNAKADSWTILDELSPGCGSPEYAEEIIV